MSSAGRSRVGGEGGAKENDPSRGVGDNPSGTIGGRVKEGGQDRGLAFEKDVAIVHPSIVCNVVRALRQVIVVRAAASGGQADRERRADQLLQFIRGNEFSQSMGTISERVRDLAALQAKERRQHDLVWEAQSGMYRSIERSHTVLESRIAHITGGHPLALVRSDEPGALPAE